MQASPATQKMQRVWWLERMPAQPTTLKVQGVWGVEHMPARPTTLPLQDLPWQGQPQGEQQEELETEGTKSPVDQESQAIKIGSRLSLQRKMKV